MSEVDPFVIPIPKAFYDDPEVKAWAEYLHKWCHDMWVRTGGGQDAIEAIDGVISGDPDADLPSGDDPAWDEEDWREFAEP